MEGAMSAMNRGGKKLDKKREAKKVGAPIAFGMP
jgi:hypothetical protein